MNTIIDLRRAPLVSPLQEIKEFLDGNTKVISIKKDISPCIGCWSCWLRTPGECVLVML